MCMFSTESDIIPTYSKYFYAITSVEAPGVTKVMFFNYEHRLVHPFATLSKGKISYTLLHPEKSICAVLYGKHDDTVAHVVLLDFQTGETFLEQDDNAPIAGSFSQDGAYFAYTRKEVMHVYDIEQRKLIRKAFDAPIVEHALFSSNNNVLCAVMLKGQKTIAVVNVRTGTLYEIPGSDGWVRHGVTFGTSDDTLGITSIQSDLSATQMLVWDVQAQKPKGTCPVPGIASCGAIDVPTQKMYFNPGDSWSAVNTFLPDKGNLQSYKIDLRSFEVVDTLTHAVETQKLFDTVNDRFGFITHDTVSIFDWKRSSVVNKFTYEKPHFVALNHDARKVITAYGHYTYVIDNI